MRLDLTPRKSTACRHSTFKSTPSTPLTSETLRAATAESQDETLRLAVKQYVPKDNRSPRKGDLTIIGAHANGFPKVRTSQHRRRPAKTYTFPRSCMSLLWDDFYIEAQKRGIRIRAIWTVDAAWQGRSSALNAGKLGNDRMLPLYPHLNGQTNASQPPGTTTPATLST